MPDAAPDPLALLVLARTVAADAGALLLDAWARPRTQVQTKSSATDMVSEMDRAAERLIVDALLAARPDDGLLGEEGSSREGTSGVRWVVDPLDGTTNYLYGLPAWAVSIGAEVDGRAVAGVVFAPALGETYAASLGGGATRNGHPISVSDATDLSTALIATGFAYSRARREQQGALVARVLPRVRDIRRGGSAAIDLCWAACGRVDAYYEAGTAPWDRAAGQLIVTEAGGVVSGVDGGAPSEEGCVAAPPALHGALLDLLDGRA